MKSGLYTTLAPAECEGSAVPNVSADGILHIPAGQSWNVVGDGSGLRNVDINTSYYVEGGWEYVGNQGAYLSSLATELVIPQIVLEPGASLRLEHVAFEGIVVVQEAAGLLLRKFNEVTITRIPYDLLHSHIMVI